MTDNNTVQTAYPVLTPSADIKRLDKLVGTWKVSGGAQGQIRFEWMEGGFFLIQHVDLVHDGRPIKGFEVIGHLRPFSGETSPDIKSRFYDTAGNTLDYVYEMAGNTLTIWGGERGSPARFVGKFSEDGNTFSGGWEWPGGGYTVTGTRIK